MTIDEISIKSFGKIQNRDFKFSDGLNLLYGPNESGKTTVLEFIKFMLYGTKIRRKQGDMSFKERYAPWSGMPVSGSMKITADDGKAYILSRIVHGSKNTLTVIDAFTGADVFENDILKNTGRFFTSLGEEAFSSGAFLSSLSAAVHSDKDGELVARLTNIADSGSEEISYTAASAALREEIAGLSSEKRKNAVLPALYNELKTVETQMADINLKVNEAEDLKKQIAGLKQRIENIKCDILTSEETKETNGAEDEIAKRTWRISEELKKINSDPMMRFASLSSEERRAVFDEDEKNNSSKNKIVKIFLAFSVLLISAGFLGFLYTPIFIFSVVGAVLMAVSFFIKKRADTRKRRNYGNIIKITKKYGCASPEEFKKCVLRYGELAAERERLVKEIEQIGSRYAQSDNSAGNKNKSNDFTIHNNNVKIDMLSSLNTELALKEEKLKAAENSGMLLNELEEKHDCLNKKISSYEKHLDALHLALEILNSAFDEMKKVFAPALAKRAGEILSAITGGKYNGLLADENFKVKLNSETGFNDGRYFSRGTYEQIYFALRLALCELAAGGKILPLFLDDAFAFYDDARLYNTLKFIKSESENRQIFISSCRSAEFLYFRNEGINIIDFNSEGND